MFILIFIVFCFFIAVVMVFPGVIMLNKGNSTHNDDVLNTGRLLIFISAFFALSAFFLYMYFCEFSVILLIATICDLFLMFDMLSDLVPYMKKKRSLKEAN